ncbi:MAG: barstar family protein [Oscillospiraceae bacterium]|nr:barstar family protein [Oscillospiraceae bacterium]MBR3083264.1 barstar family protein [Oscillospiraceae bacterium]
MKTAFLSPKEIHDLPALHAALARQLDFPAWYGANLDALHDLLSAATERTAIVLLGTRGLAAQLGPDLDRLLAVLEDLKRENSRVRVLRLP